MDGERTILIVDDDPGMLESFARLLRLSGYNVVTALDAETGWSEIARVHPDAILLDLRLPFMDGLAFLRRLRAQEKDRQLPVAIITGDYFFDETISHELHDLDARVYFKPLWLEELVLIAQRLLGGSSPS